MHRVGKGWAGGQGSRKRPWPVAQESGSSRPSWACSRNAPWPSLGAFPAGSRTPGSPDPASGEGRGHRAERCLSSAVSRVPEGRGPQSVRSVGVTRGREQAGCRTSAAMLPCVSPTFHSYEPVVPTAPATPRGGPSASEGIREDRALRTGRGQLAGWEGAALPGRPRAALSAGGQGGVLAGGLAWWGVSGPESWLPRGDGVALQGAA